MAKIRLVDIARQAGVSEATVSRVLNSRPNVAEVTQQQVLTALDVLGYERPPQLRRSRTGLVGVITPELDNPIFPAFAQVIQTALAGANYTTVLCSQTPQGVQEDEYTQMLLDRGAAGIIFVSGLHADVTAAPDRYFRLLDAGMPLVMVNGYMETLTGVPYISDDDVNALDQAVAHLAVLGHTRIGLAVGPEYYVPVIRKVRGYRQAMATYVGMTDVDDLIEGTSFDVEGGTIAAARLLAKGATAIICASDVIALGAIACAHSRGYEVPGDLSVIGYDDSPFMAFTDPPLTTLRQNVPAIGGAAAQALLAQTKLKPRQQAEPQPEQLFRPQLVIRGSTAPARR